VHNPKNIEFGTYAYNVSIRRDTSDSPYGYIALSIIHMLIIIDHAYIQYKSELL
jgi:hypothetical protein